MLTPALLPFDYPWTGNAREIVEICGRYQLLWKAEQFDLAFGAYEYWIWEIDDGYVWATFNKQGYWTSGEVQTSYGDLLSFDWERGQSRREAFDGYLAALSAYGQEKEKQAQWH